MSSSDNSFRDDRWDGAGGQGPDVVGSGRRYGPAGMDPHQQHREFDHISAPFHDDARAKRTHRGDREYPLPEQEDPPIRKTRWW